MEKGEEEQDNGKVAISYLSQGWCRNSRVVDEQGMYDAAYQISNTPRSGGKRNENFGVFGQTFNNAFGLD